MIFGKSIIIHDTLFCALGVDSRCQLNLTDTFYVVCVVVGGGGGEGDLRLIIPFS